MRRKLSAILSEDWKILLVSIILALWTWYYVQHEIKVNGNIPPEAPAFLKKAN